MTITSGIFYLFLLWLYLGHEVKFVYYIVVLVIYVCIVHYPKTQWLKTTNIYYVIVSMGEEFRRCLGGWFSGSYGIKVIWKLDWQWRICSWGVLTPWLLAGDVIALPHGPLCVLFDCGSYLAPLWTMQESMRKHS